MSDTPPSGLALAARRLVLPILVVLPVFGALLYLGQWQYQRLGWKTEILRQIAEAERGPAISLTDNPDRFAKIIVEGSFDHTREALLELEVRGPVLGARLLTPLMRQDGMPLLIDRGWVPVEQGGGISRPAGPVQVEGFVRLSEQRNRFSATDDVARRRFFTFDTAAIGETLGLPDVAPFGVVALGAGGGLPDPARHLPRPTNNHLGYAITWFGLALSLAGVFAVWARHRLKEAP